MIEFGKLNLMTDSQRKLIESVNDTKADYPVDQTLMDLFHAQVEQHGEQVALSFRGEQLTYAELHHQANRTAQLLRQNGVGRGDIVAVLIERSLDAYIAIFGALKAGAAYLPMDVNLPKERVKYLVKNSGAKAVLTKSVYMTPVEGTDALLILQDELLGFQKAKKRTGKVFDRIDLQAAADDTLPLQTEPGDLAYVIYTSGSTGLPKGVMVEHRSAVNFVDWVKKQFGMDAQSKVMQNASLFFDASVQMMFSALTCGATLCPVPDNVRIDPPAFVEWLQENDITHWDSVPSLWYQIVNHLQFHAGREKFQFPHLKAILLAGEALHADKVSLWKHLVEPNHEVYNIYGPTEATVDATFYRVADGEQKAVLPIGRPLQNMEIYILTPEMQNCLPNVVGEIYLGGVGVARGYMNNPEMSAACFVDNPLPGKSGRLYRTGDFGKLLPDGNIEFVGRRDEQIKINGQRIEISEIEQAIRDHEAVLDVAVLYNKETEGTKGVLIGYYSLQPGAELTVEQLRDSLQDKLPAIMIPGQLIEMSEFPMTANKKIDKKELAKLMITADDAEIAYVPPRTETEKLVAAIWQEVLKMERVGKEDDFFAIGGDSILSILVRHKCEQNGLTLKNVDLFKYPILSELAAYIDENKEQLKLKKQETVDRSLMLTPEQRAKLPAAATKAWPLLPMQHGMMFINETTKADDALYVVQSRFSFAGRLEEAAFEKALNVVVSRHEALRTIFRSDLFAQPVQVLLAEETLQVEWIDCRALQEAEQSARTELVMKERAKKGFNLAEWPLFHVAVVKKANNRFDVIWTIHHIIADGWSSSIVIREFLEAYAGFAQKKFKPLPPLKARYQEYINARLSLDDEEARTFWRSYLQDAVPTELPRDHVASNVGEKFSKLQVSLTAEQMGRIKQTIAKMGTTLNTFALSAYARMLKQVSRQADLLFGIVTSGRSLPVAGIEEMVGCFINTLPLRVDLHDVDTFADIVLKIGNTLNDVRAHEQLDFSDIRKQVTHLGAAELIETIFLFQNYPSTNEFTLIGEELKLTDSLEHENTHFPLTTVCYENPLTGELHFTLKYSEQFFRHETIQQWAALLVQALVQGTDHLDVPFPDWNYLSAEDHAAWEAVNETAAEIPQVSVVELFDRVADEHGERIALDLNGERLTYRELQLRANQVAHLLRSKGVREEDAVLVVAKRSRALYTAILGVLKAGAAYVPVEPDFPLERVRTILREAGAKAVLTEHDWQAQHSAQLPADLPVVVLDANGLSDPQVEDADRVAAQPTTSLPQPYEKSRPMYYIFTSGSTGKPKGVRIEQESLVNFIQWFVTSFEVNETSRVSQNASVCFDASIQSIFSALTTGATLCPLPETERKDASLWLEWLQKQKITHIDAVPSHWVQLLEAANALPERVGLPHLQWIVLGGEALDYRQTQQWRKTVRTPCRIAHVYGPTEATINATWLTVEEQEMAGKVPIGLPLPNYRLYVLDAEGRLCPPQIFGELYIGGTGLAAGYTDREATEKSFVLREGERLYRTGDIGRLVCLPNQQRCFEFSQRADEQVKVNGYRIQLDEIETHVKSVEGITHAAVVLRELAVSKQIVCFYVADREVHHELSQYLQRVLPIYMVPTLFKRMDHMPLTNSRKVDRRQLAVLLSATEPADAKQAVAPRNKLEADLMRIWQELQLPVNSIDDSFFEIGGSSLSAMQVLRKVKALVEVPVTLADLYSHSTIAELGAALQHRLDALTNLPAAEKSESAVGSDVLDETTWASWKALLWRPTTPQAFVRKWEVKPLVALSLANTDIVNAQTYLNLRIEAALDTETFAQVVREIVNAHPMLRAHIHYDAQGVPSFTEHEYGAFEVPIFDLTAYDAQSRETFFQETDRLFHAGFDVTEGPLFRMALVQEGNTSYRFFWWCSHLITDGESIRVLLRELQERYLLGRTVAGGSSMTYADYVTNLRNLRVPNPIQHAAKIERFVEANDRLQSFLDEVRTTDETYFEKTFMLSADALAGAADPVRVLYGSTARAVAAWSGQAEVPFVDIDHGRFYQGQSYFGIVGDFTDRVPLLIDTNAPQAVVERTRDMHYGTLLEQLHELPACQALVEKVVQAKFPLHFNFVEGREEEADPRSAFQVIRHQEQYGAQAHGTLHFQAVRHSEQVELTLIGFGFSEAAIDDLWQRWEQQCKAMEAVGGTVS